MTVALAIGDGRARAPAGAAQAAPGRTEPADDPDGFARIHDLAAAVTPLRPRPGPEDGGDTATAAADPPAGPASAPAGPWAVSPAILPAVLPAGPAGDAAPSVAHLWSATGPAALADGNGTGLTAGPAPGPAVPTPSGTNGGVSAGHPVADGAPDVTAAGVGAGGNAEESRAGTPPPPQVEAGAEVSTPAPAGRGGAMVASAQPGSEQAFQAAAPLAAIGHGARAAVPADALPHAGSPPDAGALPARDRENRQPTGSAGAAAAAATAEVPVAGLHMTGGTDPVAALSDTAAAAASPAGPPAGAPPHSPPAPPLPHGAMPPPVAIPALPGLLSQAAAGPTGTTEVVLEPAGLGRLQISVTGEGETLRLVLSAERPETGDLLRRHAAALLADLRAAGFAGAQLSFGPHGGSGGSAAFLRRDDRLHADLAVPATATAFPAPPPGAVPGNARGGLDLRL